MTEKDLFKLLGDLPDEMILEADPANFKKKKSPVAWIKYASAAVAAALVIALALTFLPLGTGSPSVNLPSSDSPPIHTQGSQSPNTPSGDEHPNTNTTDTNHVTDTEDDNSTHGEIIETVYWQEGKVPQTQIFLTPDALMEMYHTIPTKAWNEEEPNYWETVSVHYGYDYGQRVFDVLYERGILDPETPVIPGNLYDPSYPRIPAETIKEVYLEVWGPFHWEYLKASQKGTDDAWVPSVIQNDKAILYYEESTNSYIFHNYNRNRFPLESGDHFYGRLLYTEQDGEDLVAYIRFGNYDIKDGMFYIMPNHLENWDSNNVNSAVKPILQGTHSSSFKKDENSAYNRMFSGMFDEYLPVYRVTFKADENGKYWWYCSEKVKEAQTIPTDLLTAPIPETSPAGTLVPIYGAHDIESPVKLINVSYFEPYQGIYLFRATIQEDVLDSFCIVPGNDEVLTKKDYILTFQQNLTGETCTWEVYSSNEYPNGFGIILVNITDGTTQNWYRLER